MFHDILVSIDGSKHSDQALREAIDLAKATGARLTILSSVPTPPPLAYSTAGGAAAMEGLAGGLEEETKQNLKAAVERVPDSIGVTSVLSHEPIRKALMHQIADGNYDLLVMGSRGRGAVKASLLGSVSHFALEHSPIPVLVVHAEDGVSRDEAPEAVGSGG
jgi:nucleotide-binding universal stress UspA family protein